MPLKFRPASVCQTRSREPPKLGPRPFRLTGVSKEYGNIFSMGIRFPYSLLTSNTQNFKSRMVQTAQASAYSLLMRQFWERTTSTRMLRTAHVGQLRIRSSWPCCWHSPDSSNIPIFETLAALEGACIKVAGFQRLLPKGFATWPVQSFRILSLARPSVLSLSLSPSLSFSPLRVDLAFVWQVGILSNFQASNSSKSHVK